MTKKTERITFLVTEEKKKEIEKVAEEKGLTVSGLVMVAVSEYIKK